jgi:hypothetical protein
MLDKNNLSEEDALSPQLFGSVVNVSSSISKNGSIDPDGQHSSSKSSQGEHEAADHSAPRAGTGAGAGAGAGANGGTAQGVRPGPGSFRQDPQQYDRPGPSLGATAGGGGGGYYGSSGGSVTSKGQGRSMSHRDFGSNQAAPPNFSSRNSSSFNAGVDREKDDDCSSSQKLARNLPGAANKQPSYRESTIVSDGNVLVREPSIGKQPNRQFNNDLSAHSYNYRGKCR